MVAMVEAAVEDMTVAGAAMAVEEGGETARMHGWLSPDTLRP